MLLIMILFEYQSHKQLVYKFNTILDITSLVTLILLVPLAER